MAEMDQGIKRLVQTHPADLLAFVLPGAEYLGTLPVDVATEPQLVLDTLLHVRVEGIECAVDLEAEARPQADIARRLYKYGARVNIVTELPVFSVVVWLEPGGMPPASPYEVHVGRRTLHTWSFIDIELYKLPAQSLFAPRLLGLLPLVPFSADGKELSVIEQAALIIKDQAPADEMATLEALLAVFGARTFGPDAMRALLGRVLMNTDILETSPLYQEWMREATEKGMAQGMAQGMVQGMAQGMAQGLREGTLIALRGRFGELPPDVEEAVSRTTEDVLADALAHVGTDTIEQMRSRFGL